MFVVYDKRTNKKEFIYGVEKNRSGYVDFLIRKDGMWRWESGKYYLTLEEYREL